jgi:hypothetical protein
MTTSAIYILWFQQAGIAGSATDAIVLTAEDRSLALQAEGSRSFTLGVEGARTVYVPSENRTVVL